MNEFEEICKLASKERWCWKIFCTTCGHMDFRYAFAELAAGNSPDNDSWLVHKSNAGYSDLLGSPPTSYSEKQKEAVINICCNANLSLIAKSCKFPDWLGYLGLVLEDMASKSDSYKKLSQNWASQLSPMVSDEKEIRSRLELIAEGSGMLNIENLELCETVLMRRKRV